MDIFPLPIFPQGALSSSIITTVWVGVFVIAFFNLRLGWVLSGLVVPGYLVPLFILNPWSAGVIIFEAMITYLIVWIFSEYLSRWAPWCNFFGRDRFFALVLVSVLVRLFFDGWLLPIIGEFLVNHYQVQFDYRNQLHSFGLIIVALMANQVWKTGLIRGLIPLFSSLLITYLIVRFGLMELTNFSISQFGYLYDDLAVSILSAPKAYIIVIITAFIASRMNLHYSWDFNGILIPALLALQWYQPEKILLSFVEAFVILIIAQGVLATPLFKSMTIEGARKLLLFFNISFLYKMVLGYVMLWFMPEENTVDYYAFGYLLATLMAVKMHDKKIVLRMTRATLQISFLGILFASVLGFSMTLLPNLGAVRLPSTGSSTYLQRHEQSQLIELIYLDKVFLSQGRLHNSFVDPLPQEIDSFQYGLEDLLSYRQRREPALLESASAYFAQVNYETLLVQQRYIYLRDTKMQRGWGIYVVDLEADESLLLEIPAPLDEWGTMETGAFLFIQMQAKALAIAGSARGANKNRRSDMLTNYQSFFQTFHRVLARHNVLQIRAYTPNSLQVLNENKETPTTSSTLWVKKALPTPLLLSQLEQLIGQYQIEWTSTPFPNVQRSLTYTGFSELFLNRDDIIDLLFEQISDSVHEKRLEGYLQGWLLSDKALAPKASDLYQPARTEELLFFDKEILTPLLKIIRTEYQEGDWTQRGTEQLRILSGAAAVLGYTIVQGTKDNFLILEEQVHRRYWGTYVFRLGEAQNYMIQIPHPLSEINTFEYAVALFARLQAKVLLIGGTHPAANLDGSSDLIKYINYKSLFSLVNQVVLREAGPMLAIQSRAFAHSAEGTMADVLLAFDKGLSTQAELSQLGKNLFATIQAEGLSIEFVHGQAQTVGYEVGSLPQSLYLSATRNKEFAIVWLSPTTRKYYRQQTENKLQQSQFKALNIASVNEPIDLYGYIRTRSTGGTISKAFRARLKEYIETQDILILQDLVNIWPQNRLEYIIEVKSKQAFLLIYAGERLSLIANLFPREPDNHYHMSANDANVTVTQFIRNRAGWLEMVPME